MLSLNYRFCAYRTLFSLLGTVGNPTEQPQPEPPHAPYYYGYVSFAVAGKRCALCVVMSPEEASPHPAAKRPAASAPCGP